MRNAGRYVLRVGKYRGLINPPGGVGVWSAEVGNTSSTGAIGSSVYEQFALTTQMQVALLNRT